MSPESDDSEVDVDAAWAQIVARWDMEAESRLNPADPSEVDLRDAAHPTRRAEPDATDSAAGRVGEPRPLDDERAAGELSWDALFPDGTGFVGTGSGTGSGTDSGIGSGTGSSTGLDGPALDHPASAEAADRPRGPRDVDPLGPSLLDGLDSDDDHYRPPPPPPLPKPPLLTGLAWLGVIGAPLLLAFAALFWRTAPAFVIGLAVIGFVAGFVTLVLRMPDRQADDDDGAVV